MGSLFGRFSLRNRNSKLLYYFQAVARGLVPSLFYRARLKKLMQSAVNYDQSYLASRVNYYNKLDHVHSLTSGTKIQDFQKPKKGSVYYYDTVQFLRYFKTSLSFNYLFGDITHVPDEPSIVKSRPVEGDNRNSIILKLNKVRHYNFITDSRPFENKKNMLVGRSVVKQPHRIRFYEMYFEHPLCNLGQTNTDRNIQWVRDFLSIDQHLEYKFILCLEGYDVATNLKWVMSSNSLAVMPRPKFETWFMEGKLIPDVHYVCIKDDFSDLEERLQHFMNHPDEAIRITRNANEYVRQFQHQHREELISLMVLDKYFRQTGQ